MDLIPVLLIGLLGSVHCVGMCGGFVFALAQSSSHRKQFLQKQSMYYLGKTLMYALLGGVVGAFGHMLTSVFSQVQMALSISLGIILVLIGLGVMGLIKGQRNSIFLRPWQTISKFMGKLLGIQSQSAPLALGFINGLLPCGLVYAALALAAASGSFQAGLLTMAIFGLSTIPALFITATAGLLLKPTWRHRINMVSGGVIIALGLFTIFRGLPNAQHSHDVSQHALEQQMHHH